MGILGTGAEEIGKGLSDMPGRGCFCRIRQKEIRSKVQTSQELSQKKFSRRNGKTEKIDLCLLCNTNQTIISSS